MKKSFESRDRYFDNPPKSPGKIYMIILWACIVAFFIGLWFAFDLAGGIGTLMYLVLIVGVAAGLYEASILFF